MENNHNILHMRPNIRFSPSLGLALVYFTSQVVLGSASESNFWSERKKENAQLAALPKISQNSFHRQNILNQLPHLTTPISTLESENLFTSPQHKGLSKNLQSLFKAIPPTHGTVQDIFDPKINNQAPLVLIQDVHLNLEAQTDIASLIQGLIDQKQLGLVGVEGAFDVFDFSPYRRYPLNGLSQAVMSDLLEKNLMGAPSFVGITSPVNPPLFMGIDDRKHYDQNLEALFLSRKLKPACDKYLTQVKQRLTDEKEGVLPVDLKRFDDFRLSYHKGHLSLGTYAKHLSRYGVETDLVIQQFLEAHDMETRLDFNQVENERRRVIEKLTDVLNETEIATLVGLSLAYRMGRLGFAAYYKNIRALCAKKNLHLNKTPAFDNYIRYVLLSDGIKADQLFEAVEKIEQDILNQLIQTPEQRKIIETSEQISLAEKLLDFSLTPKEWERYQKYAQASPLTTAFSSFEKFYQQADLRSDLMVENLSSALSRAGTSSPATALIVGGFHTARITTLLRKKNIPYVIVNPNLTKGEDTAGSRYLSIFQREKTPLDRLFSGEKLFLLPDHLAVGSGGKSQMMGQLLEAMLSLISNFLTNRGPRTLTLNQPGSTTTLTLDENHEHSGLHLGPIHIQRMRHFSWGGLVLSLRRFMIRYFPWMERRYNTFWGPVLENTIVFTLQWSLMMGGGWDFFISAAFAWSLFVLAHAVEYGADLRLWKKLSLEEQASRAPPTLTNTRYSIFIALFSLIVGGLLLLPFYLLPVEFQSLVPILFGLYALYALSATFMHMELNTRVNGLALTELKQKLEYSSKILKGAQSTAVLCVFMSCGLLSWKQLGKESRKKHISDMVFGFLYGQRAYLDILFETLKSLAESRDLARSDIEEILLDLKEDFRDNDPFTNSRIEAVFRVFLSANLINERDLFSTTTPDNWEREMEVQPPHQKQKYSAPQSNGQTNLNQQEIEGKIARLVREFNDRNRTNKARLSFVHGLAPLIKLSSKPNVIPHLDLTVLVPGLNTPDPEHYLITLEIIQILAESRVAAKEDTLLLLPVLLKGLLDESQIIRFETAKTLKALVESETILTSDLMPSEAEISRNFNISAPQVKALHIENQLLLHLTNTNWIRILIEILFSEDILRTTTLQKVQPSIHEIIEKKISPLDVFNHMTPQSTLLSRIEFKNRGNAIADYHEFAKMILTLGGKGSLAPPTEFPVKTSEASQFLEFDSSIKVLPTPTLLIGDQTINLSQPTDKYGRTLTYDLPNGKTVHVKLLKINEDESVLAQEYDVMEFLREHQEEWGLLGTIPKGLGCVDIPIGFLPSLPLSSPESNEKPLILQNTSGFYTALIYETERNARGNPYRVYLNDADLSENEFLDALRVNVHDRMVMARHGLVDLEIIELFHNQEHGDGRRYDWMVDIKHHQESRRGAGRMNDFVGATLYPNLRLSGPGDLAELVTIGTLIEDTQYRDMADNRIGRLLNMVNKDEAKAEPFITMAFMGDTLLSLALMAPTYLLRRGELSYEIETNSTDTLLQKSLTILFEESAQAYSNGDNSFPYLNIQLIARQMAYFMTDQYFRDYKAGQPIPADLFPGAEIDQIPKEEKRGWVEGFGWDIRGSEKTTLHTIPSRNPDKRQKMRSADLGPVNGPNPLQELIRSFYIFLPHQIIKTNEPKREEPKILAVGQSLTEDLLNLVRSDVEDRRLLAQRLLNLVTAERFFENADASSIASGSLLWAQVSNELLSDLAAMRQRGEIDGAQAAEHLAHLTGVLGLVLSRREYQSFVYKLNEIFTDPKFEKAKGTGAWVNNGEQALRVIKNTPENEPVVLGVVKDQEKRITAELEALLRREGLTINKMKKDGKLHFVVGNEKTTVLDFVREAKKRSPLKNKSNFKLRVLILNDVPLPPAFFKLENESDTATLDREAFLFYVTQSLHAISIDTSVLPNWHLLRTHLVHA
ncbi:MAG: hypothetical protein KCHDKBKB_02783 [Elusimicrobia bacterium]|nr:hypothetical protein [Elusimicrobiota bacterium]